MTDWLFGFLCGLGVMNGVWMIIHRRAFDKIREIGEIVERISK